ncbi:hypothetical protein SAMN04487897_12538 [Paenibacillus sp. yr247]|uniref:hypothetical protein n=1 Tax=Paenibacillus sp. yr247 TaxID=1761880 RepID=UPI0008879486|nr:hypothetical protein [Paenibacillus sp. yr247]SDO87666.1 hypothetical protein SAMN04487897_12538 [Paenibacillus sp. yr247]
MPFIIGIIIVLVAFGFLKSRIDYMELNGKVGMFCLFSSGVTFLLSLIIGPFMYISLALLVIVGITAIIAIFKAVFLN